MRSLFFLTIFFNFAFPKAGFYLGDIPVTISLFLWFFCGFFSFFYFLANFSRLPNKTKIAIFLISGNFIYQIILIYFNNIDISIQKSMLIGYLLNMLIIPCSTLLTTAYFLDKYNFKFILIILRYALFIVVLYGFVSFFSLNFSGKLLGIPYLTFTGSSFNPLERYISRGLLTKIISTYNNGNILGVNLLMWGFLPFLFAKKSKTFFLNNLRAIFLLTLSRTVWIGWFLYELIVNIFIQKWNTKKLGIFILIPIMLFSIYAIIGIFYTDPLKFLFDAQLGGRLTQVQSYFSFIPNTPFNGIPEIVYAGILRNFGYLGLIIFSTTWFWFIFVPSNSKKAKIIKISIFTYAILCASDGAFILLPTQNTYWFIVQLFIHFSSNQERVSLDFNDKILLPKSESLTI